MATPYLHKARTFSGEQLQKIVADLSGAATLVAGKASVYATGSYGRLEAGEHSDLDLFIIVATKTVKDREPGKPDMIKPLLGGLDEIRLKYELIRVNDNNGLPKFDGDGKFLASHLIDSYTEWLGSNEDDYRNTLTGRMLMLLESRPLIGAELYESAIEKSINKYFRDYDEHQDNFVPSFLFNDILRMWRTFCVNYEFYRKSGDSRNKIKNLKLKFSRMLTCYSAIVYLLAVHARQGTIHRADVAAMVQFSPTERLQAIADDGFWSGAVPDRVAVTVRDALAGYSDFLELAHQKIEKAVRQYRKDEDGWRERSYAFGHKLSTIIDLLGDQSEPAARLRRLIII